MNMIKADVYRSVKHIAFYVAVGLMLFTIGMSIYTVGPLRIGMYAGPTSGEELIDSSEMTMDEYYDMSISDLRKFMKSQEGYSLDKDIQSININLYYIFIFIAAVVIAVDFTSGCAKNTLTSAINRKKYFATKAFTVMWLCLILYFANTYIMYAANRIFNGDNLASGLWDVTKIALIQMPAVLMIIAILIGIAFTVKKTAIYNLITIPFLIVLQLLFVYGSALFHIPQKVLDYTPDAMFMMLANHPDKEYLVNSYLVCAAVGALFLAAGYLTFKKSEIK